MTERESFTRAICEQPGDDVARLVFADWLEENATTDAERGRAAFIRFGCAAPQNSAVCLCFQDATFGKKPCMVCRMYGDTIKGIPRRPNGEPHCVINRGFVSEVRVPVNDFFRFMGVWFRQHPITRVVLTDVRVLERAPVFHRPRSRVYVNNVPALHHEETTGATYFPVGMKDLFRTGNFIAPYGDRDYDTLGKAYEDISHACVAFAREFCKLPPLPAPCMEVA